MSSEYGDEKSPAHSKGNAGVISSAAVDTGAVLIAGGKDQVLNEAESKRIRYVSETLYHTLHLRVQWYADGRLTYIYCL